MTKQWILKLHYAKRMPSISHSFGLFRDGVLTGVVTYGSPASPFLAMGVCGKEWRKNVLELNRLVLLNNGTNEASYLVGNSLKLLPHPSVVVSYADTAMNHIGYVYQATNWIYTGMTKERTDIRSDSGHARHKGGDDSLRQIRSAKHRYVCFVGDKRQKKVLRKAFKYDSLKYPKGDNKNYSISTDDIESRQARLDI